METSVSEPTPKEVKRVGYSIVLSRNDLPWLPVPEQETDLVRVNYGDVGMLFGSAISNKKLVSAAEQMDAHMSTIANSMLDTHLPQFVDGFNPHVKSVVNARSRQPIFYLSNNGGQRVYFMRFGKIDGLPVVVKVAVCDKARQIQVLAELTDQSKKNIKKFS